MTSQSMRFKITEENADNLVAFLHFFPLSFVILDRVPL